MDPRDPYYGRLHDMVHVLNMQYEHDLAILRIVRRRRQRRPARRAFWVRQWLTRRNQFGWYHTLMVELEREDPSNFRNFLRFEPGMFHELERRLHPMLHGEGTNYREALPPGMKLAITLRHLATGDSYRTLMFGFRVAFNTISRIVPQVCQAIIDTYKDEVVVCPNTPEQWRVVTDGFKRRWNFQHCLGAIDGKHVGMRCPPNAGSLFYNYKDFHSMILLAVVDAEYKFLWVDVGANGSCSDTQVFNSTQLIDMLRNDELGVPEEDALDGDNIPVPYFLVGDDIFALRTWMMKPFAQRNLTDPERIFNYRLSRARRVVENAFGILAHRFGCLLRKLPQHPQTVQKIVMAAVCLHNIMRLRFPLLQNVVGDRENANHDLVPGAWRDGRVLLELEAVRGGNYQTRAAKVQRLYLKHYLNSEAGAVPWQAGMI